MKTFDEEELARHNVFHQSIGICQMTMVLLTDNEKSGRTDFTEEVGVLLFRNMITGVVRKAKAIGCGFDESKEVVMDAINAVLSSVNKPHAEFMEKSVMYYAELHDEKYKHTITDDYNLDDDMTFTV